MEDKQITRQDLRKVEEYADKLFKAVGIDTRFSSHFLDRANDERNKKQITTDELVRLYREEFAKWGKKIAQLGPDAEGIMKDMRTDINVPFALNWDPRNKELDLVAKTVMRKKNFQSPDKTFPVSEEAIDEGWYDSLSAFGRGLADKATLGGYKYARAAVDYGVKNAAYALGYGKGTTYQQELDQEKEKLEKDAQDNPLASAAGDAAGYALPYARGVSTAVRTVHGAVNAAKAAGEYINSATDFGNKVRAGLQEDAPANSVSGGGIDGIGVGARGEPGVRLSARIKHKRAARRGEIEQTQEVQTLRKVTPMMENTGSFAGQTTFVVPAHVYHEARDAKRRGKHWRTYIGENDSLGHIREYANKNPKKAIILQCERTGAMCYARYGKGK